MTTKQRSALVVLVMALAIAVAYWRFGMATRSGTLPPEVVSISSEQWTAAPSHGEAPQWPTTMNRPDGPPRVETGAMDALGRPVSVSCASCHSNLQPNVDRRSGDDLTQFHTGLVFEHGSLSCLSCHNADNYNTLRLADGSQVSFSDVHLMCAQCHAPQARDFARGAHGGATGYWDASRGPQVRKNCIDCHDPHAPAFPSMMPTFKPGDRFLYPPNH